MPPRTHTLGEARRFLDWQRTDAGRELRLARHIAGATLQQVGDRLGWSKSKISRIERGRSRRVALEDLVLIGAAVGVRPSIRFFPTARPIRDVHQLRLLASLNARMHPRWSHVQEVPMPRPGDLRAADQVSTIPGCSLMVEAYSRFADSQAQVRSARAKQRDLGADRLLLLLEDSDSNRRAASAVGGEVHRSFPVPARAMLAALAAGRDPGGDGIVFLRTSPRPGRVAPVETKPGGTASHRRPVPSGATAQV